MSMCHLYYFASTNEINSNIFGGCDFSILFLPLFVMLAKQP